MAASFPNAKKTFSQIVNGVTKLVASIFNVSYDEVEAVETFIGPTGGGAQAYSESLVNMLYNYRRGCKLSYKSAADLYVKAGEIMITDVSGNKRLRRNASDLTVDWTNLDTGAEANSTEYYVYAVADASGTSFTVKISTNATTPSGCTFYKKIGAFYNDSSGNIEGITNLNLSGGIIGDYETPWFTLALNTSYPKNHYLGTIKVQITILVADNSDGSGNCAQTAASNGFDSGSMDGTNLLVLSTTALTIRTATNGLYRVNDGSGIQIYPTSGYGKIIITALE
jgi:hypothetical protein